jgi:hypothetical protein
MGAQDRPGKAQRYGPFRVVRQEYGRQGLAARPVGLVSGSRPDRQAWPKQRLQRHPFLGKKDIAESAVPGRPGKLPKKELRKIPNFTITKMNNPEYRMEMQTLTEFKASINATQPGTSMSVQLKSLWHDAKGDWDTAHAQVDHLDDRESAWVHAYLHRKERDTGNADYWYRRAGKVRPDVSLQEEWTALVEHFLHG